MKIEMFDGVVRTLENVRFIHELRKNLISLGTLDARGFHYHVSSGVMDVLAGEKVILRATKQGKNLYVLSSSTIKAVALAATSPGEMSRLWHLHLGHMSECGMKELSKNGSIPDLDGDISCVCEPF